MECALRLQLLSAELIEENGFHVVTDSDQSQVSANV